MVFRFLFRYLANNEKLIERLANSYPIKRAAQLSVYLFHRSKVAVEDAKAQEKLSKFKDTFSNELKKEWEKSIGSGKKP